MEVLQDSGAAGLQERVQEVTPREAHGPPAAAAAAPAPVGFALEAAYAWVLLVLLLAVCLFFFLAVNVVRARRRFGIKPPDVYAIKGVSAREGGPSDDADASLLRLSASECNVYNCYQRAHQHAVEIYSVFIPLLLTGGLGFPRLSAFGGLVCVFGNLVYALGYYTGEPVNRKWGACQLFGLAICFLTTFMFSIQLLWRG